MKGAAGSYGHHFISTVCHYLEDLMESVRVQKEANEKFASQCLKFVDLLREYKANPEADPQILEKSLQEIASRSKRFSKRALILENSSMIAKVIADALNAKGYSSAHYFQ